MAAELEEKVQLPPEQAMKGVLEEKVQLPPEQDMEEVLQEEENEETNGIDGKAESEGGDGQEKESMAVTLGPKVFSSGSEMFNYFLSLLCSWPPNLDINKYEHMALLDLLKKGHPEPARKIGGGIKAFQVRDHPIYESTCFFVVRADGTSEDFSFRKCVENLLPVPDHLKRRNNKKGGGQRGGGGRRGGRGHGRRGGFRK